MSPELKFQAPTSITPGQPFDIRLIPSGFDLPADVFEGAAVDSAGNTASVTITIPVENSVAVDLTGPGDINRDDNDPLLFHVTA